MPNRLATANSPYLLQHQDNPVDWHEWGPEPFEEAAERDVPVLLSVGYAACHWCHVMAHESFEDPETAEVMNRHFVNIKVDREERPDVDAIYMEAVQSMTGHGGWPMTVWLDHDARPFYAGTYFPKEPRHGMPSFREVLQALSETWTNRRGDVANQSQRITEALSRDIPAGPLPDLETLAAAYRTMETQFDPVHGGFGGAPKFPQQPVLEFFLRVRNEEWAGSAEQIISRTLGAMADGGIHDQVGGGFARYSVDNRWLVPHFEKMLYDNAQLARLYMWSGIELQRDDFVAVARSTLDYLLRDLRHPEGGFFSSEDADSEGVEGKFYVWSADEIRSILGSEAHEVIDYFGVTGGGNFEGSNILHVASENPPTRLGEAKQALLEARERRVRPGLDDKVITSWNGLAIRAFAEAGAALEEPKYLDAATAAARFAQRHLMLEGSLMRSWRNGNTSVPGFLDDHAALAVGLFALYSATGNVEWYEVAENLVGELQRFSRPEGGFYATADDAEPLIKRPVDTTDNPLPSGNALATEALLFSSLFTGDNEPRDQSEQALGAAGAIAERYPSMVGHHLAVAHSMTRTKELAIVGPDWHRLAAVYWSRFRPGVVLAGSEHVNDTVPLLRDRETEVQALAYVCEGFVCDLPTSDPARLTTLLD